MTGLRPPPLFVGDDLALDFLNSVAAPWNETIEWLENGRDFIGWLERAHAAPPHILREFGRHSNECALDAIASEARELREWFRSFVGSHAGKPLEPSVVRELGPLNERLQKDEIYRQIGASDVIGRDGIGVRNSTPVYWKEERRWRTPDALLLPIAQAMGDLICNRDFSFVRKCESSNCTLWFVDVSKAHARRWCSMAVCGNRAKAAARRARAREHSTGAVH
jgi:predicted RNA-binding Zn ribbon-like protein